MWDVFLLDSDFKIERPKRYYRLLQVDRVGADQQPDQHTDETKRAHHHHHQASGSTLTALPPHIRVSSPDTTVERQSIMSSIKSRVSRIFHSEHSPPSPHSQTNVAGRLHPNDATDDDGNMSDDGSSDSIGSSTHSEMPTPMLDPSTNTNPLLHTGVHDDDDRLEANEASKKKDGTKKVSGDVSKHTFYVVNSQLRLKLFARNEVRFFKTKSLLLDFTIPFPSFLSFYRISLFCVFSLFYLAFFSTSSFLQFTPLLTLAPSVRCSNL